MGITAARSGDAFAGQYAFVREIGRGGMATVYLADETKHGRKVAVKVLDAELGASLGAERFLREIRIAARLAHPHIVPLIDSGDAGGSLYYVSPYVAGGNLRDRLRKDGRLPIADALRITEEIGAALDYAHREGFVHRDVKPENILFADGLAVLADFGVATACCGDETVTEQGFAVGTPTYMSPEQASGERDVAGPSDIYSLGCVLFEMLTGEPPFRGANTRATMAKQITEAPRAARALRPDTPPAVERALMRALAKDPAHRWPSVAEFLGALRTEEPVHGRVYLEATRSVAVLPFVNASPDPDNEYLSDGITDELIDALAKVSGLRVASRTSAFALKGKPQDVRVVGALLGVTYVLEGTVRKSGTQLRITAQLSSTDDGRLVWSQRYDRLLDDVFAIQDEIAGTIVSTLQATSFGDVTPPRSTRPTENVKAYRLYLQGRYEWNKRTQEAITQAIAHFEQAIAEDPRYALAYTGLADSYALHVDYRSVPVAEGFARARSYARQALALDDSLAEAHASLAWTLFIYDWEWAAADAEFRRAVELDPDYATAHQWYAFLLMARGRVYEALVEAHTAQELDPASVSVRRSLAFAYIYARRYGRARHHLLQAIAMNPSAEETYRILGMLYALDDEPAEAQRVLREAVAMPGAGSYTAATLGYALARAGQADEARGILAELEARARTSYVSPVAFVTLHLGLGEHERALDYLERSRDERRGYLAYLAVNPIVDPLRGHPRFERLVGELALR